MRAGQPTGNGIRLRVYGVRLATVPAEGGFELVTDERGRLVPTGEQYRIPRAPAAPAVPTEYTETEYAESAESASRQCGCQVSECECSNQPRESHRADGDAAGPDMTQ
jgi:hypothetical protein